MNDIGRLLREARESKRFSLNDAQEKTRINVKYLSALENGQYEVLPSHTHVRGYLKNYARYLGLNPAPILEQFESGAHIGPDPSPLERPTQQDSRINVPMRTDPVFYHALEMDVNQPSAQEPSNGIWRIIGLAFIAALALIGFRFIPPLLGEDDPAGVVSDFLNETVIESVADAPVIVDPSEPTAVPAELADIITITPDPNFGLEDTAIVQATRRPIPSALDEINLKLEITERTLLIVEIDGEEVYYGTARRGDPDIEFTAIEEARVQAGNAVGVVVSINEIEYGRLGNRGQNVSEVWQTTQANDPDAPTPTPEPTLETEEADVQ